MSVDFTIKNKEEFTELQKEENLSSTKRYEAYAKILKKDKEGGEVNSHEV